ncbi:MAG: MerR family DNA-binding transcriptional regulator [Bradyrhizobiaceae bacterium]|nr:MerR family DNA-binding transcriptional regulator [Bradyrhizobiaceae bacterium]
MRTSTQKVGRSEVPDLVAGFDAGAAPRPGQDEFTIRDLIREFGVTARTLRFYEEKGLLAPRREGQDRLYSRRDRARLKYVLMGKCVGFSLEEIRDMLDLYDLGDGQVTQLKVAHERFREQIDRLQRQRQEIDRALAELERARAAVAEMLAARGAGA